MTRIDVKDLAAGICADKAAADRGRRDEKASYEAKSLKRAETTMLGVSNLFALARFSTVLDGMPTRVGFGSSNGYLSGYGAHMRDGLWRIRVENGRFHDIPSTSYRYGCTGVADHLAKTLGIPWSPEAAKGFVEVYSFGSAAEVPEAWKAMRALLPDHSVAASMSYGRETALIFGISKDSDFARVWLEVLANEGVRPDEAPAEGAPAPLAAVAASGDDVFMGMLLDRFPLADMDADVVHEALSRAAWHDRLDVLKTLRRRGAKLQGRDAAGENLLHDAMRSVSAGSFGAKRHVVEWLLREGVSPDARNSHGSTPGSYLELHLRNDRDLDRDQILHEWETDDVRALCEALDVAGYHLDDFGR